MVSYMGTQSGAKAGWAFGRVSLWGRVIEHEKGWRAQHAYPYSISIHSLSPAVASELRAEYLIDAEWAGAELFGKTLAKAGKDNEALRGQLEGIRRELTEISVALRMSAPPATPRYTAPPATARHIPWRAKDQPGVWENAVKEALRRSADGMVSSRDVADVLAEPKDPSLPLGPVEVVEAGVGLYRARLSGRVIQLRKETGKGVSRWTLPGVTVAGANWKPVVDKHADFDAEILRAFTAMMKAKKLKTGRVRDLLAHLGEDGATQSRKTLVAFSLCRAALRGQLQQLNTRPIETWSLA
jgi:hypothetical protein